MEMKNTFDVLISRLERANERISELDDDSRNLQYWKAKRKRERKKKTEYTRTVEQLQNIKYAYRKYQKRREGKKTHK